MSGGSVAMKRIMRECKEMEKRKQMFVYARPLEDQPFTWHFTIRGPPDTDYEGGIYHGSITLPYDYPMKPPYIMFFTPSGRFEVKEKICLSFTNYHPEFWQPAWTIQNILVALVSFFPVVEEQLAVGAIKASTKDRKFLAAKSGEFRCDICQQTNNQIAAEHMLAVDDKETAKKELEGNVIMDKMQTFTSSEQKPKEMPLKQENAQKVTSQKSNNTKTTIVTPEAKLQQDAAELQKKFEQPQNPKKQFDVVPQNPKPEVSFSFDLQSKEEWLKLQIKKYEQQLEQVQKVQQTQVNQNQKPASTKPSKLKPELELEFEDEQILKQLTTMSKQHRRQKVFLDQLKVAKDTLKANQGGGGLHQQNPQKELEQEEDRNQQDIAKAKEITKNAKEQSLIRYRKKLLNELEADRKKKLCVVNTLMCFCLLVVYALYYFQTSFKYESLEDFFNEYLI